MAAAPRIKEDLKFQLEVIGGPHQGQNFTFTKSSIRVGRGPENDIVLSGDPRVSRHHFEIKRRDRDFVIVNISGKNFVMVDQQSVQTEVLKKGVLIQAGDSEFRFSYEAPEEIVPPSPSPSPSPAAVATTPPSPSPLRPLPAQSGGMGTPMPPSVGGGMGVPAAHRPQSPPAYQTPSYQAPSHQMPPPSSPSRSKAPASGQGNRGRFYGIIAVLAVGGWFLFSPSKKEKKDENAIRSSVISMQDLAEADKRSQELLTLKKERYDSVQYRRAQENFVRGFRDYQQGQYARARESFQVVLNLDPENELAKRYYHLAQVKFDELVKFNMIQGNRYREKRNWRMCQSNYSNVMTMLQNRRDDPTYKEAKQYFEECTLNLEGRF